MNHQRRPFEPDEKKGYRPTGQTPEPTQPPPTAPPISEPKDDSEDEQ